MEPHDYLRIVLAPDRLAVLGAVALRERTAREVAADTGVPDREVLVLLGQLSLDGLVQREVGPPDRFRLDHDALRGIARALPQPPPADRRVLLGMTAEEREVLGRFFSGTRLVEIPSARRKRLVVLERLALDFEPGRRYEEREVNEVLLAYHDDYASLRRHLVDEGLLDRAEGRYWRSGGRVEVGEG
jgi:hypothetical protein